MVEGEGHPWVWSRSDFTFVATAYGGVWPVLSLTMSSSRLQCSVRALIIADLSWGTGEAEFSNQISAFSRI